MLLSFASVGQSAFVAYHQIATVAVNRVSVTQFRHTENNRCSSPAVLVGSFQVLSPEGMGFVPDLGNVAVWVIALPN